MSVTYTQVELRQVLFTQLLEISRLDNILVYAMASTIKRYVPILLGIYPTVTLRVGKGVVFLYGTAGLTLGAPLEILSKVMRRPQTHPQLPAAQWCLPGTWPRALERTESP